MIVITHRIFDDFIIIRYISCINWILEWPSIDMVMHWLLEWIPILLRIKSDNETLKKWQCTCKHTSSSEFYGKFTNFLQVMLKAQMTTLYISAWDLGGPRYNLYATKAYRYCQESIKWWPLKKGLCLIVAGTVKLSK